MTGVLISFEGTEGAGKTTQLDLLEASLRARGQQVLRVREPGGSALGERIRSILLDRGEVGMEPWAELCLYVASRAQLVAERIRPALAAGQIVLADRFGDASVAYQGGGRGLGARRVALLNDWATGGLRPERVFLFDLEPKVGLERIRAARGIQSFDRLEAEALDFHRRVRRAYRALARREPKRYLVIDAGLEATVIEKQIAEEVTRVIERAR